MGGSKQNYRKTMNEHVRQWLIDLIKINCQLKEISIVRDGLKLLLPVDIFETLIEKNIIQKRLTGDYAIEYPITNHHFVLIYCQPDESLINDLQMVSVNE
ncbi:MAG: hypothetical protein ACRC1D_03435 [Culicoidibacterales bacterium]